MQEVQDPVPGLGLHLVGLPAGLLVLGGVKAEDLQRDLHASLLVGPGLGLKAAQDHGLVAEANLAVFHLVGQGVLEPVLVVPLGVVLPGVGPAGLGAV